MKLFALEAGSAGETIVLIHGLGCTHAVWRDVVPSLSRTRRVIAHDLPCHGGSHPWPETGTPGKAARALLADLKERGAERFHLAGHSMGGAISVLMALAEPERVASLTLLAPGGFGRQINARLLRQFAAASSDSDVRACMEAMRGWNASVSDTEVAEEVSLRARDGYCEALTAVAEAITRDGSQGTLPREQLAALDMPIAVAWGTIDNVLPVAQTAGLPPQIALHLLPDTGHMLPVEAPDFVATLIARMTR